MPGSGCAAGISRGAGGPSVGATAPGVGADMDAMLAKVVAGSAHVAWGGFRYRIGYPAVLTEIGDFRQPPPNTTTEA